MACKQWIRIYKNKDIRKKNWIWCHLKRSSRKITQPMFSLNLLKQKMSIKRCSRHLLSSSLERRNSVFITWKLLKLDWTSQNTNSRMRSIRVPLITKLLMDGRVPVAAKILLKVNQAMIVHRLIKKILLQTWQNCHLVLKIHIIWTYSHKTLEQASRAMHFNQEIQDSLIREH